jgi:2-dehydropantoate 2-reductase
LASRAASVRAKIAVLGPGAIGSTFAYQLARAGHDVTVIARGKRLAHLERDGAIVLASGARATVTVHAALDPTIAYDLVLVSVLAAQVGPVLPVLQNSLAKRVMYMFNTFARLDDLRDAVGAERFAFGFPAVLASIDADGRLTSDIVHHGLLTTVTDVAWARAFGEAGITAVVEADIESWLRTHAAFIVPFMTVVLKSYERGAGVTWAEAARAAEAMDEGFALCRSLGNTIAPRSMVVVDKLPKAARTGLLWTASRVPSVRRTGAAGAAEPRVLIDAMVAATDDGGARLGVLKSLRP